ncbi:MAG: lytic murein transglycosylase, partial [Actinomycetota bacterium]|nr:lytic murein transglycosylase [Actinomycetota bacterium]
PGAPPIGVPNFFIDSFRIPPFLLPIYQAAGTQYEVPWQILAAINEIESDYGRNLSVSSAGAVGWMQFLPSTWQRYAVAATGNGVADPYNPVDAIFTAAKYLHAAGASKNLAGAIFAYNHADWYVQSVLLRAKLIGGIPSRLIGALAGLVEGHFPIAARTKYADNAVQRLATHRVKGTNAAIPIESDPNSTGVALFAKQGSPVIAVNDGKVLAIGKSKKLGLYLELQDSTGNVYTYAQLGSIPKRYPVPKPVKVSAAEIAQQIAVPSAPAPKQAASAGAQPTASAGAQPTAGPPSPGKASKELKTKHSTLPVTSTTNTQPTSIPQPLVKERLFAYPSRPASYAAGGELQIRSSAPQITSFSDYFSDVLHLAKNQYTLQTLKVGSVVVAGTILGRIGAGTPTAASHLWFMIRPAGKHAPFVDPKPILDGWKLLEATAVYRANRVDPFFGPGAKNPSIGQILLMSKEQLASRLLADPHVRIYACGRRDIQAGLIDRRVLAVVEFLSASALYPTVSGLECGHSLSASTGVDAAGATGASVDISAVNKIAVLGHQGPGSITDITIRRLLTLQGAMSPDEIVSMMSYKGQPNTLSLPDHANRIQVAFTPLFGENKKLSSEITSILRPAQWIQLINRINQIPEPIVPVSPSKYAIKVGG